MIDTKNIEVLLRGNQKAFDENETEILSVFQWFTCPETVTNKMQNGEKIQYMLISLNENGICETNYHRYKNIGDAIKGFIEKSSPSSRLILVSFADLLIKYKSEGVEKIKEFLTSSNFNSFTYCAAHFSPDSIDSPRSNFFEDSLIKLKRFYQIVGRQKEGCQVLQNINNLLIFIKNKDSSMTDNDVKNAISYLENENIKLVQELVL